MEEELSIFSRKKISFQCHPILEGTSCLLIEKIALWKIIPLAELIMLLQKPGGIEMENFGNNAVSCPIIDVFLYLLFFIYIVLE